VININYTKIKLKNVKITIFNSTRNHSQNYSCLNNNKGFLYNIQ